MKDAHTDRRPSHRTAEITVWDVLSLSFDEGRQPGTFKEGQRFLVSAHLPFFPIFDMNFIVVYWLTG